MNLMVPCGVMLSAKALKADAALREWLEFEPGNVRLEVLIPVEAAG